MYELTGRVRRIGEPQKFASGFTKRADRCRRLSGATETVESSRWHSAALEISTAIDSCRPQSMATESIATDSCRCDIIPPWQRS